jgi:hypothetical protein
MPNETFNERKIRILDAHGFDPRIENNRLIVFTPASRILEDGTSVDASQDEDLTDMSIRELYNWLGY